MTSLAASKSGEAFGENRSALRPGSVRSGGSASTENVCHIAEG
jgi:hypothetical protein